jgi:hypothetical protein
MKTIRYIFCVVFIIVISGCEKDYFPDGGIHSRIINRTESIYSGQKTLYIGAVVGNTFFVTDSIASNDFIDKRSGTTDADAFSKTIVYGWKPDLKKVKNKSSNGLFLFKLSAGKQLFLCPFSFPQPALDEGNVNIYIEDSGLVNYEDPNKNIKQDYEIVK